jgi:hypothetical protein
MTHRCLWLAAAVANVAERDAGNTCSQGFAMANDCWWGSGVFLIRAVHLPDVAVWFLRG